MLVNVKFLVHYHQKRKNAGIYGITLSKYNQLMLSKILIKLKLIITLDIINNYSQTNI